MCNGVHRQHIQHDIYMWTIRPCYSRQRDDHTYDHRVRTRSDIENSKILDNDSGRRKEKLEIGTCRECEQH